MSPGPSAHWPFRWTPPARQDGFGLIEVIVAALIGMVALFLIVDAAVTSGRALTKADMRRMQVEVGRAASQQLMADQSWGQSRADCRDSWRPQASACDLSTLVAQGSWLVQRVGGKEARFRVTASAKGVDSASDGQDGADADRRLPDWFELTIAVAPDRPVRGLKDYQVRASTDSATRTSGGVLVVRGCRLDEQVDERIELGECSASRRFQLEPPGGGGTLDRDAAPYDDAPGWAREVSVAPAQMRCTVTGPGGPVTLATGADGSWTSPTSLPVGTHKVSCGSPAAGLVPWPSKTTVPADGSVRIEEDRTTTVMLAWQPRPVQVDVEQATIHFDTVGKARLTRRAEDYAGREGSLPLQLVPVPYGRVKLPPATPGSRGVTLDGVLPGLYGNTVVVGSVQYYLYTAGPPVGSLPMNFGAPVKWIYVHPDGTVSFVPGVRPGGLWQVQWWCHSGALGSQRPCPGGAVPSGRGAMALRGAGGSGGT